METFAVARFASRLLQHVLKLLDDVLESGNRQFDGERNVIGGLQVKDAAELSGAAPTLTSATGITLLLRPSAAS
jgi:cystathionine beta-lyase/cystathionine gamma-synthase